MRMEEGSGTQRRKIRLKRPTARAEDEDLEGGAEVRKLRRILVHEPG